MHQFGCSQKEVGGGVGNFLNLLQNEGVPRKGGFPQKRGGCSKKLCNILLCIIFDLTRNTVDEIATATLEPIQ